MWRGEKLRQPFPKRETVGEIFRKESKKKREEKNTPKQEEGQNERWRVIGSMTSWCQEPLNSRPKEDREHADWGLGGKREHHFHRC